jgi:hypothetical protein
MELGALSRPFLDGFVLSGCPSFEEWLGGPVRASATSVHEALKWACADGDGEGGDVRTGGSGENPAPSGDVARRGASGRGGDALAPHLPLSWPEGEERPSRSIVFCGSDCRRSSASFHSEETEALYRHFSAVWSERSPEVLLRGRRQFLFRQGQDLAALEAACAAGRGRPRVFVVCGEAGVGKTLLLSKFFRGATGGSGAFRNGAPPRGGGTLLPGTTCSESSALPDGSRRGRSPPRTVLFSERAFLRCGWAALWRRSPSLRPHGAILADCVSSHRRERGSSF